MMALLSTRRRRSILAVAGLVLLAGAGTLTYAGRGVLDPAEPAAGEQVQNLRAFAKLYGYVRYFHPSDAAARTDWDRFAVYGARRVKDAASPTELRAALDSLFASIAPTVQLYRTGENPPEPSALLTPADTVGLRLVAWQHFSVGMEDSGLLPDSLPPSPYKSRRLHRGHEPLFDTRPVPGETARKPLGRGLSAQVPLALYSRDGQTLRPPGAPSPEALREQVSSVLADVSGEDMDLYPANVVIAWNVFQHFYPYFGVVDVDWDQVLTQSLRRSRADTSRTDFLRTLRRMVARLKDGHGYVSHPDEQRTWLPLQFGWVEGEVVVVDTASYAGGKGCVRPGDVVATIGNTSAGKALQEKRRLVSGAPQLKTERALRRLGSAPAETPLRLSLRRRGRVVECHVPRGDGLEARRWLRRLQAEARPRPVDTLPGGVRYVDLTRVEAEALRPRLSALAQADAVIFDMRGYPTSSFWGLLQHLSQDTLRSPRFQVPQRIYPDQENQAGYFTSQWTRSPNEPHFTGEIVFLTDPGAISAAETLMGIVEHYRLGEIVGETTAGANGGINPFKLPGGYRVNWTGLRTRKQDGSQHHLIGIQPTVEAERTIEGVRAGKDEVLQKALEVIRGNSKSEE